MLKQLLAIGSQGMHGPRYGNMHEAERSLSMVGGVGLFAHGLARRDAVGLGLAALGGLLAWRGATGHSHLYAAFGINTARSENVDRAGSDAVSSIPHGQGTLVAAQVLISRNPDELFQFWKDQENLSQVMDHVLSVQRTGDNRWHWVALGPFDIPIEWDAELVNIRTNELIAWRSLEGSEIANAGSVHFIPTEHPTKGTLVRVLLKYNAFGGQASTLLARLLGADPGTRLHEDLHAFKRRVETGQEEALPLQRRPSGRIPPPPAVPHGVNFEIDRSTATSDEPPSPPTSDTL